MNEYGKLVGFEVSLGLNLPLLLFSRVGMSSSSFCPLTWVPWCSLSVHSRLRGVRGTGGLASRLHLAPTLARARPQGHLCPFLLTPPPLSAHALCPTDTGFPLPTHSSPCPTSSTTSTPCFSATGTSTRSRGMEGTKERPGPQTAPGPWRAATCTRSSSWCCTTPSWCWCASRCRW